MIRRRKFITLLGAAAAWPVVARGQPGERVRRVGVLLPAVPDDREYQSQVSAFQQTLQQLGWTDGGNLRIEMRWATPNAAEIRKHATELVALMPDVILSHGSSTVGPLLQLTRTVPVVFPVAVDPVAAGLVDSLARPGGNATGFTTYEYGTAGKGARPRSPTDVTRPRRRGDRMSRLRVREAI